MAATVCTRNQTYHRNTMPGKILCRWQWIGHSLVVFVHWPGEPACQSYQYRIKGMGYIWKYLGEKLKIRQYSANVRWKWWPKENNNASARVAENIDFHQNILVSGRKKGVRCLPKELLWDRPLLLNSFCLKWIQQ